MHPSALQLFVRISQRGGRAAGEQTGHVAAAGVVRLSHKCYIETMTTVGLRELRQGASDLVRRVEAGEEITISVSGRPSAVLVPVRPTRWRAWRDVGDLFRGTADPDWADDRDLVAQEIQDPWARR